MSEAKPHKPKRGRPRCAEIRNNGAAVKPTISAQLEPDERKRLEAICKETGRSLSYVVRAAVLLLLTENDAKRIDWAFSPEQTGFIFVRHKE